MKYQYCLIISMAVVLQCYAMGEEESQKQKEYQHFTIFTAVGDGFHTFHFKAEKDVVPHNQYGNYEVVLRRMCESYFQAKPEDSTFNITELINLAQKNKNITKK